MSKGVLRFLLVGALAAALAEGGTRVPEALAAVDAFRIRGVRVEGARFISASEALRVAALPVGASVWDASDAWEARLRAHPLVLDARIRRKLPDSLVFELVERQPVALVAIPTLEPVDRDGHVLPVDPAEHRLDLPLLRIGAGSDNGAPGAPGVARIRPLALEVERLARAEPSFMGLVSELAWDRGGDAVALWGDPALTVRFRPPLAAHRVREAVSVIADAARRFPDRRLRTVDLRYADQVVVRF
ncbi:MAG TPA: FtsQ-type POTRA domain-containing protein [Longimicrobiales bacterium]|jgi:cell division septal protein FtsQ